MSEFNRDQTVYVNEQAGLKDYIVGVFTKMGIALLITAASAYGLYASNLIGRMAMSSPGILSMLYMLAIAVEFGIVIYLSSRLTTMSTNTATGLFYGYAVVTGLTFSTLFYAYDASTIAISFLFTAVVFFREMGEYAAEHNTVIGMEANPPIYNTNYINDTKAALDLIEKVGSKGFKLNLDVGTMIANEEEVSVLAGREHFINHVHISEPGLKPIEQRWLHKALSELLNDFGYNGFVSIEVGKQENVAELDRMMRYTEEVFG